MPVASSQYWNSIHGAAPGEAEKDEEGRQTMRTLARNMTFLIEEYCTWKRAVWISGKRSKDSDKFYSVEQVKGRDL